jgi:hypothetical protein
MVLTPSTFCGSGGNRFCKTLKSRACITHWDWPADVGQENSELLHITLLISVSKLGSETGHHCLSACTKAGLRGECSRKLIYSSTIELWLISGGRASRASRKHHNIPECI